MSNQSDPSEANQAMPAAPTGGETSAPGQAIVVNNRRPAALEMRQVAGLTAGSVMVLHEGSFQFRESAKEVGFALVVDQDENVVVIAGSSAAYVDEIEVTEPTPVGDAVLHVGSACFTVRRTRPEPSGGYLMSVLEAARTPPGAITVPDFEDAGALPEQVKSSRFGALFSGKPDEAPTALDAESWTFLESIRDIRSLVAERHRRLHPNPEELRSRLQRLEPGLWDRSMEHSLFARFAIAYSTIPWEPRFDNPERIPERLYDPIKEMSQLPWVPITANLLNGPLGIVGARPAVLACARNAVLSLAALSSPEDIEFSIVTAQGLIEDWAWTSSLPNSLFPQGHNGYCIAVADGMSHFEGAGMTHDAVRKNEMGLIVLAESLDELPEYCGTVLELLPTGECRVTNHLGEQVSGTPIGVAANFAAATAAMIKDAVGDGPAEEDLPEPRFQNGDPVEDRPNAVPPPRSSASAAEAETSDEPLTESTGPALFAIQGGLGRPESEDAVLTEEIQRRDFATDEDVDGPTEAPPSLEELPSIDDLFGGADNAGDASALEPETYSEPTSDTLDLDISDRSE